MHKVYNGVDAHKEINALALAFNGQADAAFYGNYAKEDWGEINAR